MAYLMCYTKRGEERFSELDDAMHLALCTDGVHYRPLRHNTGILFPEADLEEGGLAGTSKTLTDPWLFRLADGSIGVAAVRRNRYRKPDSRFLGCIVLYRTRELTEYEQIGFLKLGEEEIRHPSCRYDGGSGQYELEWEENGICFAAETADFKEIHGRRPAPREAVFCDANGITDAIPSNQLELSEEEAQGLRLRLETPFHTEVRVEEVEAPKGSPLNAGMLPEAECIYSDGSRRRMKVRWNAGDVAAIDTGNAGSYRVRGEILQKRYPEPLTERTGDPFILNYKGRYLMTWSGANRVTIRAADTLEGLHTAEPKVIYELPAEPAGLGNMWAPEFHEIGGVLYLFTTVGEQGKWYTVRSCVLKCSGDPERRESWGDPIYCVKRDGTILNEEGITLDMTYFQVENRHYVMWSHRVLDKENYQANELGTNGDAALYIAAIDPEEPWRLASDPVCVCRPRYGWDRIENEINEGPYLLRHGEDLFVTFSGSSVGSLYCVGLLQAKAGTDLLDPGNWKEFPYPALTKESVPGQYGPGHNHFLKDPDGSGDDLMVLHAKALRETEAPDISDRINPRNALIRRVHWNALGLPVLDMTPEQELAPALREVTCRVCVGDSHSPQNV